VTLLETRGLGKDYGGVAAVHSLDLRIEAGEIVGLLGPNGAGKTTAISMICGVVTPSRGSVAVAGHDLGAEPMAARRALGLVPQDLAIYEDITARQNLAFFGAMYGLSRAELGERVGWALEVAGLGGRADEPVVRYSGGMKRRLNLAAGLLHRPRLLICDEPTVGVDPQSRNHLFETIRTLNAEGTTVLYTSHYMEEVQALCSRVAIMDGGVVIAEGSLDELVGDGDGGVDLILDGDREAAATALGALAAVVIDGGRVRVPAGPSPGAIVRAVEDSGATIRSLRTRSPDLETVFLELTGKSLRDDA
jgi:ABC-2 type transport system ATP-binding protein